MVVPAGNAPASPAYRAGALLLSYGTLAEGVGNAPTSARADPVFGTGAASLYLPAFRGRSARIADSQSLIAHSKTVSSPVFLARVIGYGLFAEGAGCQGWIRTNTARLNRPACYC